MLWSLILLYCGASMCMPVPLPSPGAGYPSEQACLEAGERWAKQRHADQFVCRPRMDPGGERDA